MIHTMAKNIHSKLMQAKKGRDYGVVITFQNFHLLDNTFKIHMFNKNK